MATIDNGKSITELKFTPCSKYLIIAVDNGNIYTLEAIKVIRGREQSSYGEPTER